MENYKGRLLQTRLGVLARSVGARLLEQHGNRGPWLQIQRRASFRG